MKEYRCMSIVKYMGMSWCYFSPSPLLCLSSSLAGGVWCSGEGSALDWKAEVHVSGPVYKSDKWPYFFFCVQRRLGGIRGGTDRISGKVNWKVPGPSNYLFNQWPNPLYFVFTEYLWVLAVVAMIPAEGNPPGLWLGVIWVSCNCSNK